MEALLYFIITIAILVFVHEFGHFAAAKLSKMRVDAFAIGFGYRLFGYNAVTGFTFGRLPEDLDLEGKTDYRLCALPLGGYVKIAGMIDESLDTEFASSEPKPYEFRAATTPKKIFVITAGVLMNLILALVIFWGINFFIGQNLTKTTTIGFVEAGTPADSAGFKAGDKILTINGASVSYWEDVQNSIYVKTIGKDLSVLIDRSGEKITVPVKRSSIPKQDKAMFLTQSGLHPVVGDLLKGQPAAKAGIKAGDVLLAINDTSLNAIPQTIKAFSYYAETPVKLSVLRQKDTVDFNFAPNKEGKIGVMLGGYAYFGKTEQRTFGIIESATKGVGDAVNITALTFSMIGKVFTGQIKFGQAFGGPVKIAQFAERSADTGMVSFLMFLAMLSLSLAILNILPFPVLDGGHLVIIIIEAIIKRELPLKLKIYIQNIGFALMLALMAFVIYNDIINL